MGIPKMPKELKCAILVWFLIASAAILKAGGYYMATVVFTSIGFGFMFIISIKDCVYLANKETHNEKKSCYDWAFFIFEIVSLVILGTEAITCWIKMVK